MSPLTLTWKSLLNRKFSVFLTVVSLGLGVALLLGVERMRREARTSFTNTISGTDLIVGARTGQTSLLLSTVFRIGNPTQNISWETYEKIAGNPMVAWTIPISLGDSHRGFRVLGTTTDYFAHYRYADKQPLAMAEGREFADTYDAVIGSEVARKLGYQLGDEVVLAHGAGEVSFVEHADKPFRVAGILKPTGTPVDQCVHVSLAGIEAVHEGWDGHAGHGHEGHNHPAPPEGGADPHAGHDHGEHGDEPHEEEGEDGCAPGDDTGEEPDIVAEDGKTGLELLEELEAELARRDGEHLQPTQITAFLVGMHSRPDAVFLQRAINTYNAEPLSAVMPGVALQELWQVVGAVEKTLLAISIFVVAVSLAGMLSVLMSSLNERRREMAILRSMGARPFHIVGLVAGEAVLVTAIGIGLGIAILYGLLAVARPIVLERAGLRLDFSLLSAGEGLLILAVLAVGLLVGLLPAWRCYRNSLADGLTIRT